ncbi:MAG: hypothetical protein HUJ25_03335 [Crocinitomicaceae bacterium]|nr:hypothetical protein [Crocinitomicaceae bacterium]
MKRLPLLLAATVLTLVACEKEVIAPVEPSNTQTANPIALENETNLLVEPSFNETSEGCEETFELYAGQSIDVGEVVVTNDENYIYVTFNTEGGWVLNETHVYAGDPAGIPTNNSGNPQIGLFPYNDTHNGATSFTVIIPIDPNLECYAIAAHASVSLMNEWGEIVQQETAWSNGPQINSGGSWATYSEFCLLECGCEYETVSYEYFAGQNIQIGSLDVTNDADYLYVTFNFTGDWYMGHTHLYVGDAAGIPVNGGGNPMPGQFPYQESHDPAVQSYTYTIPLAGLNECYAIAAHAEVMMINEEGEVVQTETGWSSGTGFSGNNWGWYSEYCTQECE